MWADFYPTDELTCPSSHRTGKGYASRLLAWQIDRYQEGYSVVSSEQKTAKVPSVYLEATEDYTQKIYERLGFRELGRTSMLLRVDKKGLKTKGTKKESFDIRAMRLEMNDFRMSVTH